MRLGEGDGAPVGRVWLSGRGNCVEGERDEGREIEEAVDSYDE